MTLLLDSPIAVSTRSQVVCHVSDLEPCWGEAALVGALQIALFALPDGSLHAVSHQCPTTGARVMARGIVGSKRIGHGDVATIACPLHKEVFRLDTGECLSGSAPQLAVYPVSQEQGWVSVSVASATAAA
jgi:NAD(P)H-dependent nitrite reductase small subunit